MNYKKFHKEPKVEKRCPFCKSKEVITCAEWLDRDKLHRIDDKFVEINAQLECLSCSKIFNDKYIINLEKNQTI